jgi:hypothetical protein
MRATLFLWRLNIPVEHGFRDCGAHNINLDFIGHVAAKTSVIRVGSGRRSTKAIEWAGMPATWKISVN